MNRYRLIACSVAWLAFALLAWAPTACRASRHCARGYTSAGRRPAGARASPRRTTTSAATAARQRQQFGRRRTRPRRSGAPRSRAPAQRAPRRPAGPAARAPPCAHLAPRPRPVGLDADRAGRVDRAAPRSTLADDSISIREGRVTSGRGPPRAPSRASLLPPHPRPDPSRSPDPRPPPLDPSTRSHSAVPTARLLPCPLAAGRAVSRPEHPKPVSGRSRVRRPEGTTACSHLALEWRCSMKRLITSLALCVRSSSPSPPRSLSLRAAARRPARRPRRSRRSREDHGDATSEAEWPSKDRGSQEGDAGPQLGDPGAAGGAARRGRGLCRQDHRRPALQDRSTSWSRRTSCPKASTRSSIPWWSRSRPRARQRRCRREATRHEGREAGHRQVASSARTPRVPPVRRRHPRQARRTNPPRGGAQVSDHGLRLAALRSVGAALPTSGSPRPARRSPLDDAAHHVHAAHAPARRWCSARSGGAAARG